MSYSYQSLRTMDKAAFCHDILRLKLFSSTATDAELFDAEVRRVLDLHAPLQTSRRRCGQHDNRSMSEKVRHAKQLRRRLERRYRRTDFHQTSRPTSLLVPPHVTASSDCVLIASSLNLMKYRETSALPGERYRDFTASTRPSTTTLRVRRS